MEALFILTVLTIQQMTEQSLHVFFLLTYPNFVHDGRFK